MELDKETHELKEKIRSRLNRYIERSGLKFNENLEHVEAILSGLAQRQKEHGRAYCPCRMLTGDSREDGKKTCPCKWHLEEIERDGACHCQLFVG